MASIASIVPRYVEGTGKYCTLLKSPGPDETLEAHGAWTSQWEVALPSGHTRIFTVTLLNGYKKKPLIGRKVTTYIQADDGSEGRTRTATVIAGEDQYSIDPDNFTDLGHNLKVGKIRKAKKGKKPSFTKIADIWQQHVSFYIKKLIEKNKRDETVSLLDLQVVSEELSNLSEESSSSAITLPEKHRNITPPDLTTRRLTGATDDFKLSDNSDTPFRFSKETKESKGHHQKAHSSENLTKANFGPSPLSSSNGNPTPTASFESPNSMKKRSCSTKDVTLQAPPIKRSPLKEERSLSPSSPSKEEKPKETQIKEPTSPTTETTEAKEEVTPPTTETPPKEQSKTSLIKRIYTKICTRKVIGAITAAVASVVTGLLITTRYYNKEDPYDDSY